MIARPNGRGSGDGPSDGRALDAACAGWMAAARWPWLLGGVTPLDTAPPGGHGVAASADRAANGCGGRAAAAACVRAAHAVRLLTNACEYRRRIWRWVAQFVADGVFYAELNELLTRELAEEGYSGVEVRVTPTRQEIIIRATRTQNVLGEKGKRIRELTSVVQKRFNFPEGSVELYAERVANRGLCAIAQAESLRYKLLGGLAVRRACYGVLRFIMESGAKGAEVIVSGKLRAARAKSMKFVDGFMVHSGQPTKDFIDRAVRHVLLRQGTRRSPGRGDHRTAACLGGALTRWAATSSLLRARRRCARYSGQDHAAVGRHRQDWPEEAAAGCHHRL